MKRGLVTGCAVLTILCCVSTAFAGGDPNYVLSIGGGGTYGNADTATLIATLDSSTGGDVQGWSLGMCVDPAFLQVDSVASGATTLIANNSDPMNPEEAEFVEQAVFANGVTQGVVICFTGCAVLLPGSGYELCEMGVTVLATSGSTSIDICDTLGTPPVATVIVVNGQSLGPVTSGATITVPNPNELVANDGFGLLGGTIDTTIDNVGVNNPAIDGAQIALTYDAAVIGVNAVANTVAADFFEVQPGNAGELVIGIIIDTTDPIDNTIPGDATTTLVTVTWDALTVGTSALTFTDGLGNPATDNALFSGQTTLEQPTLVDGTVTVVNFNPFIRSDCNFDGQVDIADGIYGLNYLFQGGPDPTCDDACDSNDDSLIDAADMIYIFNYRFLEGPAPLAPFPAADLDPTQGDGLGCNNDADDQP